MDTADLPLDFDFPPAEMSEQEKLEMALSLINEVINDSDTKTKLILLNSVTVIYKILKLYYAKKQTTLPFAQEDKTS